MAGTDPMPAQPLPTIEALGEDALLLRFGDAMDDTGNARVLACASAIASRRPAWVVEIIPAYASLAVCFDRRLVPGNEGAVSTVRRWLLQHATRGATPRAGRVVNVPVHYGGDDGPDLHDVATHAGMTLDEVIDRHCAPIYRVAMLGFAPGFPYLLGLDPALAMPRLSTPRTRVAAGSIGIGNTQAGIYPRAGPGGWRVIGRTDIRLFDATIEPPALLAPGDRVRFLDARAGNVRP